MSRLLVTGGAGFIGANFVRYWLEKHPGDRLVVLDALTYAGNLASLEPIKSRTELRFVRGNICDTLLVEQLLREECLDTIVHFAAESHVDRSIHGPDAFIETNVNGTHSMLKAARKVWLEEMVVSRHRFHHVSTDEVYGSLGPQDPPFVETRPYAPNSPYSASKAGSDHLVRAYHHTYGLRVSVSNCSNNYGPYHFPEKLIPLMIVNMLLGCPLSIYGDGRNVRDWLYVDDHCRGIDLILSADREGAVYNIGGRSECENIQVVQMLCSLVDRRFREEAALRSRFPACPASSRKSTGVLVRFVRDRLGHDRRYSIDCRKIESELGFRPSVPLEEGLGRTLSWYLENESWWRSVMDGSHQRWIEAHYGDVRHDSPVSRTD